MVHSVYGNFYKYDVIIWRHVYIERSQLVQYFTHSFTTCQVLNDNASYEYQKNECVQQWNLFKCQTSTFYSSTYCLNLFEHLLIHAGQTVRETRLLRSLDQSYRPGLFSSTTLSRPQANFLHQTCIAGLVKYLSPYTGLISEWMVFGQRLFAQRKWITERCSLRDAFSGSVAIFIVDKWRYSDVIVIKLTAVIQN